MGGGAALPLPAGLGELKTDLKAQVWARIGVLEQGRLRLVKKNNNFVAATASRPCGGSKVETVRRNASRRQPRGAADPQHHDYQQRKSRETAPKRKHAF